MTGQDAATNTAARPARRVRLQVRPRWHKVLADLWGNMVRTLLVVASISVGLFAVGMITTIHDILAADIRASYAATNPANILVYAADFDEDMVDTVRKLPAVRDAEGVRSVDLMARTAPGEWSRITLRAIHHFDKATINQVQVVRGAWPPAERQVVIEKNKLGDLYMPDGMLEIKLPSGKIRQLPLAGVVHDQTVGIASTSGGYFLAPMQGFITTDTLAWLEQPDSYNLLYVTVASQPDDAAHIREIANQVTKAIEDNNGLVYNAMVRGTHDHPNAAYADAISGVLFLLGLLVVFLSAFLITNTLSALLNQQAQQIAIMKTIGARSYQVSGIYMALILAFSLLALALAVPLSREAAFKLLGYLAERTNFDVVRYRTVPLAVALQVVIALVVPQAAGLAPILRGARIRVQDALTGISSEEAGWKSPVGHKTRAGKKGIAGKGSAARAVPGRRRPPKRRTPKRRTPKRRFRLLSRPMLISLRNTFRRKGRLVLTLVTLTLGGAIFIGTFNVQASMESYIRKLGRYFLADVNLTLDAPYRMSTIADELRAVPGVGQVEGWGYARTELLLDNDKIGDAVQLVGPPVNSTLIQPILIKGRWLQPGDRDAIVLSERFISAYPHLQVGEPIRLRVNGDKTTWTVVGFFQLAGKSAGFVAYTSYDYLSEKIHQPNRALTYRITADRANLTVDEQRLLGAAIEEHLQARGYGVTDVTAGGSLIVNSARGLDTLTAVLLILAMLTALVGSIGLMGTMSMNVLDRTREIGVMRAIGASDRTVMNLVMVEGLLIGLISWVLGTLLAAPISKVLSDTIQMAVFDAPGEFTFTSTGPLYWLGLVLALSVIASVIPARAAARLTIREALAYE